MSNVTLIGTGVDTVYRLEGNEASAVAQVSRPTFLASCHGHVYGVSEVGHGQIFRIGADEYIPSGGSFPCHITAYGNWLYVSNYGDGIVRAVQVLGGGGFGSVVDLVHEGRGPNPDRQAGPHAHFAEVVDDRLIVADLGTDELRTYRLDEGRPETEPGLIQMPAGSGPRHFVVTGDGEKLLVAGELDGTVSEVSLDTGQVERTVSAATATGDHYLSHIEVVDGYVIVGVRGSNTLSLLDHDLNIVQEIETATWPRHFAITQSQLGGERAVVVAGERSDQVVWHPLGDEGEGLRLNEESHSVAVPTPMFIGIGDGF